jgi:hypothetical protein
MVKKHNNEEYKEDEKVSKHKKNDSSKALKNLLMIAGGILGLIIIFGAFLSIRNIPDTNTNNYNPSQNTPQTTCRDIQVPYDDIEYYTESEPYTDQQCDNKLVVYSITDFNFVSSICNSKIEECTNYVLGFCTSKNVYCTNRIVTCSLKVNNLDDERASWTINFNFMKSGTSNIVATTPVSLGLYPHTSDTSSGSGRITIKEAYDTQYTCNYNVPNEPMKQVCHDVIKYRDVQKQRTVTKYRTEQKCS